MKKILLLIATLGLISVPCFGQITYGSIVLLPNGVSSPDQWTQTGGASKGAAVGDLETISTYNSETTLNEQQTWSLPDTVFPALAYIDTVRLTTYMCKPVPGTGTASLRVDIYDGSSAVTGTAHALITSDAIEGCGDVIIDGFTLSPASAVWTPTSVNSLLIRGTLTATTAGTGAVFETSATVVYRAINNTRCGGNGENVNEKRGYRCCGSVVTRIH